MDDTVFNFSLYLFCLVARAQTCSTVLMKSSWFPVLFFHHQVNVSGRFFLDALYRVEEVTLYS